jgi:hypothetical protein
MMKKYPLLLILFTILLGACNSQAPATTPTLPSLETEPLAEPSLPQSTGTPSPTPEPTSTQLPVPRATETVRLRPTWTQPVMTGPAPTTEPRPGREGLKDCSIGSLGLIPVSDMVSGETYMGETGGLYGDGENSPPAAHAENARRESALIVPRGPDGSPSPDGKIVMIALGMSNAKMEFDTFGGIAIPVKSNAVELINGAWPGVLASDWAYPTAENDPWRALAARLERKGLTPQQVQVAWLKEANADPQPGTDDFPVYAEKLRDDMAIMVMRVKELYPNVRVLYLSSRIFSGYSLIRLSPEPFAYEGAFSNRWLIEDQINGGGATGVTYENAPVLLWGPYLWADGTQPRSDGLTWECNDFVEDGVHPTDAGRQKVADMMLDFFMNDPLTRVWFSGLR